ncbi:MAG: hypothetical protein B7Z37_14125 [Verrucomicrobia bacterium 12-59-8]|nr:MAG: hypothetical protein B7Z37_14125 [Verrucomicrobia bacterium 12-59-8]
MTSLRLLFAALLASTLLISCKSLEHVDSKYPTVSQQDAYDLSWGLAPRKARGNPKMRYQYNSRAEQAAPMSLEPSAPAPAPVLAPAPAASSAPSSPAPIPATLR